MAYIPPSERIENLSKNPTTYHFDGVVTDVLEEAVNVRLTGSLSIIRNVPVWTGIDIKKINKRMKVRLGNHNGRRYVTAYFIECSTDLIYEPKGCEDPPPPNIKVGAAVGGIYITWSESNGATEYIIYVSDVSGDRVEVGRTKELEILIAQDLPDGYKTFSVVAKDGDCYSENFYQEIGFGDDYDHGTTVSPPTPIPEIDEPDIPGKDENGNSEGASVCVRYDSYSLNAPPFYNTDTPYVEVEQHKRKCTITVPGIPDSYHDYEYLRYRLEIATVGMDDTKDYGIRFTTDFPFSFVDEKCNVNRQYRVRGIGQATSADPENPPGASVWSEWTPCESDVSETQESIGTFRDSEFPREIPMDGAETKFRFRPVGWDKQVGLWTNWLPSSAPYDWEAAAKPIRAKAPVPDGQKDEQLGMFGKTNVVIDNISPGLSEMIWWNRAYHISHSTDGCPSVGLSGYSKFSDTPDYIVIGAPANYRYMCGGYDIEVADNEGGNNPTLYQFSASQLPRNLPLTGDHWIRIKGNSLTGGCRQIWTPFMKAENHAVFKHVAVGHNGTTVGVIHDKFTTGLSPNNQVWLSTFEAGGGGGSSVLIHTTGMSLSNFVMTIPAISGPSTAQFYDVEWKLQGSSTVEGKLENIPVENFPLPIILPDGANREYRLCYKTSCKISIGLPNDVGDGSSYSVQIKIMPTTNTSNMLPVNTTDLGRKTFAEFPVKYDISPLVINKDCKLYAVRARVKALNPTVPEDWSAWFEPESDKYCGNWSPITPVSVAGTSAGEVGSVAICGLGTDKFFLAFNFSSSVSGGSIAYCCLTDLSGNILENSHTIWGYHGGQISVDSLDENRVVASIGSSVWLFEVPVDNAIPVPVGASVSLGQDTGGNGHKGIAHLGDGVCVIAWNSDNHARASSFQVQGNKIIPGSSITVSGSGGGFPCVAKLDSGSAIVAYQLDAGSFSPCSGEGGSDQGVGGANIVFVGEDGLLSVREEIVFDQIRSLPIYADMDFLKYTNTISITSEPSLGAIIAYEPDVLVPPEIEWTGIKQVEMLQVQEDLTLDFYGGGTFTGTTFTKGSARTMPIPPADLDGSQIVMIPATTGYFHHPDIYWPTIPCEKDMAVGLRGQFNGNLGVYDHYWLYNVEPTTFPYNILTIDGRSFGSSNEGAFSWVQFSISHDDGETWSSFIASSTVCGEPAILRLPVTYYEDTTPPPKILVHALLRAECGVILFDLATAIERPPDIYPRVTVLSVSDPQATECAEWSPTGGVVTPLDNGKTITTNAGMPGQTLTSRGTGMTPIFSTPVTETAQLRDVEIANPQEGQALVFQALTNTFVNKTISTLDSGVSNGDILYWSVEDDSYISTKWENEPTEGQVPAWDATLKTWTPKNILELLMGNIEPTPYLFDQSAYGTFNVIVGVSGKRIKVWGYDLIESGAMKMRWKLGSSSLGWQDFSQKGNGISRAVGMFPVFTLADGETLAIELAASVNNTSGTASQVGGFIACTIEDVVVV